MCVLCFSVEALEHFFNVCTVQLTTQDLASWNDESSFCSHSQVDCLSCNFEFGAQIKRKFLNILGCLNLNLHKQNLCNKRTWE